MKITRIDGNPYRIIIIAVSIIIAIVISITAIIKSTKSNDSDSQIDLKPAAEQVLDNSKSERITTVLTPPKSSPEVTLVELKTNSEPISSYGDWTYEDYLLLATTIYCEADYHGYIEEAKAIGQVIRNRLDDKDTWNDDSWIDVISRDNPKQFSVYDTNPESEFQKIMSSIDQNDDLLSNNAKEAALLVMNEGYGIPSEVQFFCSVDYYNTVKKDNGNWSSHELYDIIGGTAFFYK